MTKLNVQSECKTLVKWEVSNFSTVAARDNPEKRLNSGDFQLDSSSIKCYLQFRPASIDVKDKNYSSLFLFVRNFAGQSAIKLRYDLWIENKLGEKISTTNDTEYVFEKKSPTHGCGYPQFVHHDTLYCAESKLIKNNFIFLCARIVREDVLPEPLAEFHQNLWLSYKEGFTGECVLKVSGGEFKVSKTLLTAHSKVFKAMFTSRMKEQATGVVELHNFNVKTINALIEYLHKESVDHLSEVAVELFKAADKYSIKGLKTQCEESLVKTLNKNNLRDRLILAFTYKAEVLKTGVLNFIEASKDGLLASIVASREWIDFAGQNEELAPKIIAAVFERLNFKH